MSDMAHVAALLRECAAELAAAQDPYNVLSDSTAMRRVWSLSEECTKVADQIAQTELAQ